MASAAAHAGDYGTAIKKELESVGERIGEEHMALLRMTWRELCAR